MALVPGCLALLPDYASLVDPVAALREACRTAVEWLGPEVQVAASTQGARIATALLAEHGKRVVEAGDHQPPADLLVLANGSASRSEKAPGHLDPRAADFDDDLDLAIRRPDAPKLQLLDRALADDLWADVSALVGVSGILAGMRTLAVDYDADPFGVRYWVVRWVDEG